MTIFSSSPNFRRGFMALLAVIVLSAVTVAAGATAALVGLDELNLGVTDNYGAETFALAEACLDEALGQLRHDFDYGAGGPINLTLGRGSCIIAVSGAGGTRTVVTTSQMNNFHKKIRATVVSGGGVLNLTSWEEASD